VSKKYIITIELWSKHHSLDEITTLLGGAKPNSGHSIGDKRTARRSWQESAWKLDVGEYDDDSLGQGWADLCESFISIESNLRSALSDEPRPSLSVVIGILASTATIGITVPNRVLRIVTDASCDLEITSYPCE
jgi:hypothetical protein